MTIINSVDYFQFVPSNPWVLVGWRAPAKVSVPLARALGTEGIELVVGKAAAIHAPENTSRWPTARRSPTIFC